PVVDDTGKVLDVRLGAVEELLRFGFRNERAAEAGADGINKNEVGEVEPRARIIDQRGRIGRTIAFVADAFKVLGADGPEVKVDRRSPGTAVKGECDGTIRSFDGVCGKDDFACLFAVLVANGQRPDSGGVAQRLPVQLDALFYVRIRRKRRQAGFFRRFIRFIGSGFISRFVFVCLRGGGKCRTDEYAESSYACSPDLMKVHEEYDTW